MTFSIADAMRRVRASRPLVHHITNYVTVNDCANATICAGGSPVMTDAAEDVVDMAGIASSIVLNIGTLNERTVASMIAAGKRANERGIPVILDPVGVGATGYRTEVAGRILREVRVSIVKGNTGEIGILAGTGGEVKGVDSAGGSGDPAEAVRTLARRLGCVVAMTGETDYASDGDRTFSVRNGDVLMEAVSGTGCMTASVVGCYAAVCDDLLTGTVAAMAVLSVAGEIAAAGAKGPGSFRVGLLDALHGLDPQAAESAANVSVL